MVILSYILGQIPLAIAFYSLPSPGFDIVKDLQSYYGLTTTMVLLMFPLVFIFFVQVLLVKFWHRWSVLSMFTTRSKLSWQRIVVGAMFWIVFLLGGILLEGTAELKWNLQWSKFVILLPTALIILPIQCAAEELIFRGYVLQWIGDSTKKPIIAALFSGILFGLLHTSNPEVAALGIMAIIYYLWSGIFLGFLAVMDDGIELTLGYHIGNNLFAAVILTNTWNVFQTDALFMDQSAPHFSWISLVTLIVGQTLFVFLSAKIFKWGNLTSKFKNAFRV